MNLSELEHKVQQWAAEYAEIGGQPVPKGFVRFLVTRMNEAGIAETDRDWVVIYRDGQRQKVQILSQSGTIVSFRNESGTISTCTIMQMKKWCKASDLARAVDHVCFGETSEYQKVMARLTTEMGGTSGTGTVAANQIKTEDD